MSTHDESINDDMTDEARKLAYAAEALEKICNLADKIKELCHDGVSKGCDSDGAIHVSAAADLAALAGWHGDVALQRITDSPGVKGGADDWFLSPRHADALGQLSAAQ